MFIPLRHENMEGRRWPVVSIALVVLNLVLFLATHSQIDKQESPEQSAVRAHLVMLAAMHPELNIPPAAQEFVSAIQKTKPGLWHEAQSQTRDIADGWDAKIRLMEDPASLQREMDSLAEQFSSQKEDSLLEHYAFVPAHPLTSVTSPPTSCTVAGSTCLETCGFFGLRAPFWKIHGAELSTPFSISLPELVPCSFMPG